MVAGQTIIADIFPPVTRGRAVGCLMVGGVAGTAIGALGCLFFLPVTDKKKQDLALVVLL